MIRRLSYLRSIGLLRRHAPTWFTLIRNKFIRTRVHRRTRRYFILTLLVLLLICHNFQWNRRLPPRALKEFRRTFLVNWNQSLNRALHKMKYQLHDHDLHVHVVSLKRTPERGRETTLSLQVQGIPWSVHEAVDGLDIPDSVLVSKYAGAKKRNRMKPTFLLDKDTLIHLEEKYDRSESIPDILRQSLHERLRFGCFMSHVTLWQEIERFGLPFAIVLEDDALIVTNFARKVTARLQRLPEDWDLLYLGGCYEHLGPRYDLGLLQSRGGLCTYGYILSAKGAGYLLRRAVLRSEKPIDHVLDDEISRGNLIAFHSDPPLVHYEHMKASTLAY